MRKIIILTFRVTVAIIAVLGVMFLFTSRNMSANETLKDDVAAMITDAKTTPHISYIIDTSESMNVFAYSDYINTCEDSLRNAQHAVDLCLSAWQQCLNTEANAMCAPNLNCPSVKAQCDDLTATRNEINAHCVKIHAHYSEPPKNSLPAGWENLRLKYVGPWTPNEYYSHDFCYYNWTMDTGGEVLSETTSGHWTNPGGAGGTTASGIPFAATDRRDWDCVTDGMLPVGSISGLWMNWKYATALDAVKIILADSHEFSYPPRTRGSTRCVESDYYPRKSESYLSGHVCYSDAIDFSSLNAADKTLFVNYVRSNWEFNKTDLGIAPCAIPVDFKYVDPIPPSSYPDELSGCEVCRNIVKHGGEYIEVPTDCKRDAIGATFTNMGPWVGEGDVSVNLSCCMNYYCDDPKCRDDDTKCFSEGGICNLGYYSTFDQDQSHCCEPLVCLEEGSAAAGCTTDPVFLPGPGNSSGTEFEITVGMGGLSDPDQTYGDASLSTVTITKFDITYPGAIESMQMELLWGCRDAGFPTNEFYSATYDGNPTWPSAPFSISGTALNGCGTEGYKVGVRLMLYHKGGTNYGKAEVSVEVELRSEWTIYNREWIEVFDKNAFLFEETKEEVIGGPADKVNEYECKNMMYHRQSYVENGGTGNCNWNKLKKPDGTPYERCVYPSHRVIAQDQWGPQKSSCSWLCREGEVYDDVWKCRDFFSQMDDIMRGGPGVCKNLCYNKTNSLKSCCECIHNNNGLYNYLNLEPPERVWFDAASAGAGGVQYNCHVSGFVEGITNDGGRVYIQGFMSEVVKGHIQEAGDSSYKLIVTDESAASPYAGWYSEWSLLEADDSYLEKVVSTFFKTGKSGSRDTACIYDIITTFSGADCDDCGTGCCSIDIDSNKDYCEFPSFWAQIPNAEGGELIIDFTDPTKHLGNITLNDIEKPRFKTTIANLKARGGATLGETLYDVWRYLGGMRAAHDPNFRDAATHYTSPYQDTDPSCFINEAVIISGGQPHFDTNEAVRPLTAQALPAHPPYVLSDASDLPTAEKPWQRENWHLTSILEVARFVTTEDFFWRSDQIEEDHADTLACRTNYANNIYGFASNATDCLPYDGTTGVVERDDTGVNVISKINTIAIGEWALAPLYTGGDNDYLEESLLKNVVQVTTPPGSYYGLTADVPSSSGTLHSFNDLTSLFASLTAEGLPDDVFAGRPHWTSGAVQPFGPYQTFRGPTVYFPAAFPIDNLTSRFWFGNFKKYYLDGSGGCAQIADGVPHGGLWKSKGGLAPDDCFAPGDLGTDITAVSTRGDFQEQVRHINAGGAAKLLADRVDGLSCGAFPCYINATGSAAAEIRRIFFDGDLFPMDRLIALKLLKDRSPAENAQLRNLMVLASPEHEKVFDYIYGFDAYEQFGALTSRRFSGIAGDGAVEVDNPFNTTTSGKIRIRPLILGAIIHSNPVAVHYGDSDTTRIYVGANDGMLHSFDQDGNEVFGYIPSPVLPKLAAINSPTAGIIFNSTVDGPITLFHIDKSGDGIVMPGEKAYLIFGYRRGASYYTVLDVSDPDTPVFVQHINMNGAQSWGKPLVFRKPDGYYLALPGGYDNTCFDALAPACNNPVTVKGNGMKILKLNTGTGKFDPVFNFGYAAHANMRANDHLWMRASFVADPIAVNTEGLLLKDTEFVYFVDITGTVFRLNTRSNNTADWKLRVVFTMREIANRDVIDWQDGIRSYVSFATFPPLTTKYPSFISTAVATMGEKRVPIPVFTGNMVSTTIAEPDKVAAFYDLYDFPDADDPIVLSSLHPLTAAEQVADGAADYSEKEGWEFLLTKDTEKTISKPLLHYDRFQSHRYTIWFNTYVPADYGFCKDFGTTRSYGRDLITGGRGHAGFGDNLFWEGDKASISSDVGVVMTPQGERIAFGAGDRIFWLETPFTFQSNLLDIIKWYELY